MKLHEIIIFIFIAIALFRPDYVLNKFYPKFQYSELQISNLELVTLKPDRDVHIKVTRRTEYGDRYKLFVIEKGSFSETYSLKDFGVNLEDKEGRMTVDTLEWNGLAKKSGLETGDVISEFKIENLDRPNKAIIYPFALFILFAFGYMNYRRKS